MARKELFLFLSALFLQNISADFFSQINQELAPVYLSERADYFISLDATDAKTARGVCRNLQSLTGKKFRLLVLEDEEEMDELLQHLQNLETNVTGIWMNARKYFDSNGEISVFWETDNGELPITFKNFHRGLSIKKRSINDDDYSLQAGGSNVSYSKVLHPWVVEPRCRKGKVNPQGCEPINCTVNLEDCTTNTPPCKIIEPEKCSVQRTPCSACDNCTVIPAECYAETQNCTVVQEDCTLVHQYDCNVTRTNCTTVKPTCKTIQPPCLPSDPQPCTTHRPCIPNFRKKNCTEVTFPCTTNKKNETVCPPPQTVCQKMVDCPPPDVCRPPPIICPAPLTYCEPATTICDDAEVSCPPPLPYCPPPTVVCPDPIIHCSKPQVLCDAPVVNCGNIVTICTPPVVECPPAEVICPKPDVQCSDPKPCPQPENPNPCDPEETTTTQKSCGGCGCVLMSRKHEMLWDIDSCEKEFHFICKGEA